MKQFKTKKSFPGVEAGTLSFTEYNINFAFVGNAKTFIFNIDEIKKFPDFFEEVKELEKVFDIQDLFKVIKFGIFAPDDLAMKQLELFIAENHPQHIEQLKHLK